MSDENNNQEDKEQNTMQTELVEKSVWSQKSI